MSTCQKSKSLPVIPVSNPRANYLAHKEEIDEAIAHVLEAGQYILGPQVEAFEEEFARYIGVDYCVGVASGTDALILALQSLCLPLRTRVVTTTYAPSPTAAAITYAGFAPVFLDVWEERMAMENWNPALSLEPDRPVVVMPVHMFGMAEDVYNMRNAVDLYPKRNGLPNAFLIEDCAQAAGAMFYNPIDYDLEDNKRLGAYGDLACFSFYPTKNLGCLGDGGVVVTSEEDLYWSLRRQRQYGWFLRGYSEFPAGVSRLDELQAAVLRVKLTYLDAENDRRRHIARKYAHGFKDLPVKVPTTLWPAPCILDHIYHQFVIRAPSRDKLRACLLMNGINTGCHYRVPLHMQPAFSKYKSGLLPVAQKYSRECVSLPMYPELTDEEIERVIAAVRGYYEQ